jgi:glycosyltransferase involved in cell wall biosynthesis
VTAPSTTVVVPCYDEAERLRLDGFAPLIDGGARILFVDDGSRDQTRVVLGRAVLRWPERAEVLALPANSGKAEAVRQGLLQAVQGGPDVVGYLDADLATPAEEMLRLRDALEAAGADAVLGARVALLGRDIQRRAARHYFGRVFATVASAVLGMAVYDTQCGAKLFRRTPALERALTEPFHSRWAFDVELLGRILPARVIEVPLETWHDVKGSKISPVEMVRAGLELGRIGLELRRWRRKHPG